MKTWVMSLDGAPGRWADLTLPPDSRYMPKTSELRRTACRIAPGDRVLIYATAPVAAIIGHVYCLRVRRVPVFQLAQGFWPMSHQVPEDELRAYAGELDALTVIDWHCRQRFSSPLPLAELRHLGLKRPPQTWCAASPALAAAAGRLARIDLGDRRLGHKRPIHVKGCLNCGGTVVFWTRAPQCLPCDDHGHWPADECEGCQAQPLGEGDYAAHNDDHGICQDCVTWHHMGVDDDGVRPYMSPPSEVQ